MAATITTFLPTNRDASHRGGGPLRNLTELRPTRAIILRMAADLASVWVAALSGWLLLQGAEGTAWQTVRLVLLAGLLSVLTPISLMAAGVYRRELHDDVATKIRVIAETNLALLLVGCVAVMFIEHPAVPSLALLFSALLGGAMLQSLSRVASAVLRSEEGRKRVGGEREAPDERRVLVIGGGGYIGSALVEKLLKLDFQVSILDALHFGEDSLCRVASHSNLTLIREDFRHIEALTRAMGGMASVIHLGGLVGDPACAFDTDLTVDVNVTATKVIGEIAKAQGVRRLIFASSCSVYGACDEIVNEESHFNPQSLYARSKVASEAVLGALNDRDFAVTCLRFATIYGISGRTRFDLVVNLLCAKAARDRLITVFGPDQWRPFVHVEDVAQAIVTVLRAPTELVAGEAFNVGSDSQNYTLGQVAELIKRQVPEAEILLDDSFVDKRNYRVAFAKIRSRLGFEPRWTLEEGIAQVTALVRSNRVGHYSESTYSNVLYLKEHGTVGFNRFKITGWENEFMSLDRIVSAGAAQRSAA